MCYLAVQFVVVLAFANACLGEQLKLPYTVQVVVDGSNTSPDSLTLQCIDQASFKVTNAVFFRNGVWENTTDGCVPASKNGQMTFNDTPMCDGHYLCGTAADEGGGLILSGPLTVIGKFYSRFCMVFLFSYYADQVVRVACMHDFPRECLYSVHIWEFSAYWTILTKDSYYTYAVFR